MRMRITKGHLRLRGRIYWCQWKYKNRPFQVSLETGNEREARLLFERQMTFVRAAILDGTHDEKFATDSEPAQTDEATDDIPLSKAWTRYLSCVTKPDTGESTLAQYAFQFGRLVTWSRRHQGPKTICGFTKVAARQFAADLGETVGAATFNKYVNLYRLVFRVLLDELDVQGNPWEGIQRRKTNNSGRRAFTAQEIAAIFTLLDRMVAGEGTLLQNDGSETVRRLDADKVVWAEEMRTLCLVAFHTGLRFGDCSTLLWTEVDLGKEVIVRVPNKTKRRHPDRPVTIPFTPELRDHLLSLSHVDVGGYVCPHAAEKYLHNDSFGRSESSDAFMHLLNLAGIRAHKPGTGKGTANRAVVEVGFHSFRHTWVTMSAEAGVDAATVRAIVGWGSPAMERVYTHIGEEHLRLAMSKRPSVADTTRVAEARTNINGATALTTANPSAALDGLDKAGLERLRAAIDKCLNEAEGNRQ